MLENSNFEILMMCLAMGMTMMFIIAIMLVLEYIKKNRDKRERDKQYIGMDSERRYYEEKIYELQKQLSKNERRWLDANNLIVSGQTKDGVGQRKINFILDIPFFKSLGIDSSDLIIDKKSVFVLTPFVESESKTYMVIQEVCNTVGLNCRRGDEEYRKNDILAHIVTGIVRSKIIIVNINGRNPNVFYELGICHAIGKPVIIISSIKDDIPFDVMSKNIFIYKSIDSLRNQLKDELLKMYIDESNT